MTDKLTPQQKLAKLVEEAEAALAEAEAFANEHNLTFTFEPAYGMGGTFYPGARCHDDSWLSDHIGSEGGWISSSAEC